MITRWAYANPKTVDEYNEAISEAWNQANGLAALYFLNNDKGFQAEADRWLDRALTLEMEFEQTRYDAMDIARKVGKL